ncbi:MULTISPECIES: hypothetical protein [unclassified Sphingomonas]|uniref:hypothetical protein n=1 Tax=unclassified Sphingomonas TaxID=196159 RepID=UPI00226A0657|nr:MULTISPECIES: hypothetical protein [unclassified Sphingomonas]
MKITVAALACPIVLAPLLAACATDSGAYPSLAPRPIEKLGFAEPVTKPVEAKPDPALDARIATLGTSLEGIAKGFAADAAKADAAGRKARGAAVGSDAWLDAQTALAQLDDWRAQASSLLTDLDQAASDRAASLAPDYPALTTLRGKAQEEVDAQTATITRLQHALPAA